MVRELVERDGLGAVGALDGRQQLGDAALDVGGGHEERAKSIDE